MSSKNDKHAGHEGLDDSTTKNKGESQQSNQQGAKSISKSDTGKHTKDESHGSDDNSTKKQQNAI